MALLSDLINLNLSSDEKFVAEYIWIGGSGMDLRSKARTLPRPARHLSELPKWNYDGSSTGQTPGHDSDVILCPQATFKDPIRGGDNILVICDTYTPAGEPMPTNKRFSAENTFSHLGVAEEPWFSIEQEYTLLQKDVKWPLGGPAGGNPGPQGPYYCGIGADKAWGRDIADAHYKACLYAGINVSGINAGVMPGQWEFQIGPSVGISAGDELWAARYILERITENAGVVISFDPKPIQGVANPGASIQVGSNMDRRPASNMDPYVETSMIARRMHAGTSIDRGIAYVLMLVALVLTYLIHSVDMSYGS